MNTLGKVGTAGLKVFAAGTTAAVTGLSALGTAAVNTFADYEQLVGGVETLFGAGGQSLGEYAASVGTSITEIKAEYDSLQNAQAEVLDNASKAYKTAGLSANDYMETVTSFAAALKQSTASELEAAEAADQAIIDMSDNANKMGTSMESIQNAYQGFAKQNYTMLDNLKLGYGGTKDEMKRLLADATALTGIEYDLDSLSDVYEAIHVIQTELGITGTTAKEASTTISGSANAMKASWQNLIVGIADDGQDFDTLVDNFVESTITAADNILPRIGTVVEGIGQLIDKIAPIIIEKIPEIVLEVAPDLLQAGMQMVFTLIEGISENIPEIVDIIHEMVDMFLDELGELVPGINPVTDAVQSLIDNFDTVLAVIIPLTAAFVAWKTAVSIVGIVNAFSKAMDGMTLAQYAAKIAQDLLNKSMLANPIVLITTLLVGLVAGFIYLWNTSEGFRNFWIELWECISTTAIAVVEAIITFFTITIPDAFNSFIEKAGNLISDFVSALVENASQLLTAALEIITVLSEGLSTYLPNLLAKVPELITRILNKFNELVSCFDQVGTNIINGIWSGLSAGWNWLVDKVKGLASSLFNAAKEALDINSPSKKFEWLADMCIAGFDNRMDDFMNPNHMTRNINATLGVMKNNISGGNYIGSSNGAGNVYQNVYVNKEVATADELARAIRIESRYGMMRGVPVG